MKNELYKEFKRVLKEVQDCGTPVTEDSHFLIMQEGFPLETAVEYYKTTNMAIYGTDGSKWVRGEKVSGRL